jgi:putative hydrolases of HD superfamily
MSSGPSDPRPAAAHTAEIPDRQDELDGVLEFLRTAERLKTVTRSGWTSAGEAESVAEHTWRLALMAMVLYGRAPGIQLARLLQMCIIHDLGEAIGGDVPAPAQSAATGKAAREREDLQALLAPLPAAVREDIVALWDEYEAASSTEARLAKGLDKLETILQHTQGLNPTDFDYDFNLAYGRQYTGADAVLSALRARLDEATARRADASRDRPTPEKGTPHGSRAGGARQDDTAHLD